MNAMQSVLDQVTTSSRAYLTWMALRAPAATATPPTGSVLPPADFNQSWSQFTALMAAQGIPELDSPLSD